MINEKQASNFVNGLFEKVEHTEHKKKRDHDKLSEPSVIINEKTAQSYVGNLLNF